MPQVANSITVYPNPVKGNTIQLKLLAVKKGNYKAVLIDALGKTIAIQSFEHTGETATKTLQFKSASSIKNGLYQLHIDGNGLIKTIPIYISNNN